MELEPGNQSQIIFYTGVDGDIHLGVFFVDENLWLTQKQMAELFDVDVRTINKHLKNIFNSGELDEISVVRNFRITASRKLVVTLKALFNEIKLLFGALCIYSCPYCKEICG